MDGRMDVWVKDWIGLTWLCKLILMLFAPLSRAFSNNSFTAPARSTTTCPATICRTESVPIFVIEGVGGADIS